MVETVLQTKLYIPPLRPNLVSRPDLKDRLNQGLGGKLTLVSAPAGFGKTTLVSEWLSRPASGTGAAPDFDLAWLSIDKYDNDAVRFFTYLVTALQRIDASVGQALLGMLRAPKLPPQDTFIGSLLNDIAGLSTSIILVLDDYHRIDNRFIHETLSYILEHQPAQLHLVIITREDPPLLLARLQARGQMTEIRQDDLRFSADETALFFTQSMAIPLTPENARALRDRTEGWVGGLQLAALSMRGRADLGEFVASFAGSNRYILDYLMEEVFRRQSDQLQAFLLDTAILDRLTASLCDAVTKRDDSRQQLSFLEGANLFVVPLDDSRQWYRYHHLFVELLRHRIRIEKRPVEALHRRASRWYETNGFLEDAIAHSLEAQDWQQASSLINDSADRLLRRSQMSTLLGWIQALPDEVTYSQPQLGLSYAWALVLTGQLDQAEQIVAPISQVASQYPALESEVVILQAYIARSRRDAPRTIALSEQALRLIPPDDYNSRSIVGVNLGIAYIYAGALTAAIAALETGIEAARRSKNHQSHLVALTFLGRLHAAQGRLHRAVDLYRQAIRLWEERPSLLPVARTHVDLATILHEWNELAAAENHLQLGIELSRRSGEIEIQIAGQRGLASLRLAQEDRDGAQEALRVATKLAQSDDIPPNVHLALHMATLRTAVAQGDLALAERTLAQATAREAEIDPSWAFMLTVTGIVRPFLELEEASLLLAQEEKTAAAERLAVAVENAGHDGLENTLVAAHIQQALIAPTNETAVAHLAASLMLAQQENYTRLFLDAGEALIPLLRRAHQQNVAPRYVVKLLAAFEATHPSPSTFSQPLVEPLSERELEILQLLANHRTNAEIAQTTMVSINTVKTHLRHIYEKLGVHDRRAAVTRARELMLIRKQT